MTLEELDKKIKEKTSDTRIYNGLTPSSLLGIAFIVLKLTGVISWSWWWVLAPIWIPFGIALLLIVIAFIVVFIAASKYEPKVNTPVENKKPTAKRSNKKKKADE